MEQSIGFGMSYLGLLSPLRAFEGILSALEKLLLKVELGMCLPGGKWWIVVGRGMGICGLCYLLYELLWRWRSP